MQKTSAAQDTPCEIRVGQVGLTQIRLRSIDPAAIRNELSARIAAAPQFFQRTAVCVDVSKLTDEPSVEELRAALAAISSTGFFPVGLVQSSEGTDNVEVLARSLDLPVISQWRTPPKPALGAILRDLKAQQEKPATPATPAPAPTPRPVAPVEAPPQPTIALLHYEPIRSGQRVYARNRDLIVMNSVGAGAEVMSDGCVHVYGSLRGRALAGARGEKTARVFCQEFNAELVSIAGVFRVFETIPAELAGKPVMAWLAGDDLRFTLIGSA